MIKEFLFNRTFDVMTTGFDRNNLINDYSEKTILIGTLK